MSRKIQIAIGLLLSLGAASLLTIHTGVRADLNTRLVTEGLWAIATLVLLAYVALVERLPLSSAGLRPLSWRDALIGAGGGAVLILWTVVIYLSLFPILILSISLSHTPNTLQMPLWYRFILVTRLAFADEFLFRGYAIERLNELGLGKWIAGAISLALYIAVHWSSWNPVESIAMCFTGTALTGLYLWRRNVWVNMIARWMAEGAGYLLH
jgi:membrane protease YdiL (CAAX protease family)